MPDDPWDEAAEFEEAATLVEQIRPLADPDRLDTAKHNSTEYLAGREAGLTDGMEAAKTALVRLLKQDGWTPEEIARLTTRVSVAALEKA